MESTLKLHHLFLALIVFPLCFLIFAGYGWIGYATITNRPGLSGDWYLYLQLSRVQFFFYNLIVSCSALGFIVILAKNLLEKQLKYLNWTFWAFLIFIGLLILFEIYLNTRFQGKG